MKCDVCNGEDFAEEDGLFYCSECLTRKEGERVQVYDDKFEEDGGPQSQWLVSSQIRMEPREGTANDKILTSWETFNICLKGLVDQLIQFGATQKLDALVFHLWTTYLKKTGAAFFSVENLPPRLPRHAWKSDTVLMLNHKPINMSVEKLVGKNQKGRKRNIIEIADDTADVPSEDVEPSTKLSRNKEREMKRKFFNRTFVDTASETVGPDTTDLMSLSYVPETDPTGSQNEEFPTFDDPGFSKVDDPELVPLKRKHLLAFIYLGVLLSREEIYLSDILRWIDEGHLHFNQLDKFFMPGVAVLNDLKEYFMDKKITPSYSATSVLTRKLAVYLNIRSVPPPDLNRLVHKYCDEFNLPNQVGLVSRRLINLLPTRCQDPHLIVTMTSYETRAMAQIIVTLKILFGLDDATEHRNSKIAAVITETLKKGGSTIEPFIWDEWVRWNALRSIALLLHGHTSVTPLKDTGLYQNIDSLVLAWGNFVSSSTVARDSVRRKMETEFMSELIKSLDPATFSFDQDNRRFPPTTTPLALYTDAVIKDLVQNRLPCSDDSWNSIVRNIDFSELMRDFRCKSIEYLLHPERYIEWAQEKGLSIGLRNGGAFQTAYKPSKTVINKESYSKHKTSWRVSLTKKSKKNCEKKVQNPGTKSVVVPAATRADKTDGRPLEPLLDLTEHVPAPRVKTNPPPAPPAAPMPPPGEEDKYLHLPSSEYHTQSGKAREAPISFRYLTEQAARYLRISGSDLLEEVTYLENIHKNFLDFCSGTIDKDSPEIIALKE